MATELDDALAYLIEGLTLTVVEMRQRYQNDPAALGVVNEIHDKLFTEMVKRSRFIRSGAI